MVKANILHKNKDIKIFFDIPSLEGDFLKRAFVSAVEQSRIHLGFPYTFR